jgi:aryl-alcohol dehydrogenase-like predicted oxidoreductase
VDAVRSADELNVRIKLAQLAIAWLAGNPIVGSVIAGATSAEQVVQNAAAAVPTAVTRPTISGVAR